MASRYFYRAWLRDLRDDVDAPADQWWVAFTVEADTPTQAADWGDKLTKDYCSRFKENRFVTSEVTRAATEPLAGLDFPTLRYGELASDKLMGW